MSPHFEGPNDAPTAVDFFAGCGGLSYGLMAGGFQVKAAWEMDDMARATYHKHHCEPNDIALHRDATNIQPSKVPDDLDLLAGGPPCKAFSTGQGETKPNDPRNLLPFSMIKWADEIKPKAVLMENVTGMSYHHQDTLDSLIDELEDVGYQTKLLSLNAVNYGVPQTRERLFIIGIRNDISPPNTWEPPRTCTEGQQRLGDLGGNGRWPKNGYETVDDAIGELPEPIDPDPAKDDPIHHTLAEQGRVPDNQYTRNRVDPITVSGFVTQNGEETWMPTNHKWQDHTTEHQEKMASYELGESGPPTTKRRLHPTEPAPTITHSSGTPPVHYIGKAPSKTGKVEDVRRLTVRELARIQTFPDEFTFAGTKTEQYELVANAVPPLLSHHIAAHLRTTVFADSTKAAETHKKATA